MEPPTVIKTGRLMRDASGFVLEADDGAHYRLELARVPVDHVAKRVRVTGALAGEGRIVAEGVAAE
jgi:hypothetical protein